MAIILQESLRGLFYAPYYAALALGAYDKEGVEVRFAGAPGFGNAPTGLYDGSTDVAWGGPMRVNQVYDQRAHCDLVCFGEAVTRDPFMLVGRAPRPNFALTDLASARIATVSEVPTPWLCLQHDLRLAGIDPARLDRVADRGMADNMAALRAGRSMSCSCSSRWPRNCSPTGRGICGTRRRAAVRARTRPSTRGAGCSRPSATRCGCWCGGSIGRRNGWMRSRPRRWRMWCKAISRQ